MNTSDLPVAEQLERLARDETKIAEAYRGVRALRLEALCPVGREALERALNELEQAQDECRGQRRRLRASSGVDGR